MIKHLDIIIAVFSSEAAPATQNGFVKVPDSVMDDEFSRALSNLMIQGQCHHWAPRHYIV
jgi:hypothetical protein